MRGRGEWHASRNAARQACSRVYDEQHCSSHDGCPSLWSGRGEVSKRAQHAGAQGRLSATWEKAQAVAASRQRDGSPRGAARRALFARHQEIAVINVGNRARLKGRLQLRQREEGTPMIRTTTV